MILGITQVISSSFKDIDLASRMQKDVDKARERAVMQYIMFRDSANMIYSDAPRKLHKNHPEVQAFRESLMHINHISWLLDISRSYAHSRQNILMTT